MGGSSAREEVSCPLPGEKSKVMPAPVRDVRDYCESMGEDLDDFESDVGANYKLRYEVQEIDTASERKMSTLTLLQSGCFLTD